jgi:hypothetical protein
LYSAGVVCSAASETPFQNSNGSEPAIWTLVLIRVSIAA